MEGGCLLWVASEVLSLCMIIEVCTVSIAGSLCFFVYWTWIAHAGAGFAYGLLHILEMQHLLDLALFPL